MRPRIGLALSGGGFRATAFGLGSLRALHDRGLLEQIAVVSGISGGSLLAAMWAYGPEQFEEFDESVVDLLRTGLQLELARRAFAPMAVFQATTSAARSLIGHQPRKHSRTDALVSALAERSFGARSITETTRLDLETVISSTDLRTGNAVRFGSALSASSPYGTILDDVTVAEAVSASAAFPILLPALSREYEFQRSNGTRHRERLVMTDGGVYDNLGLAPLLPGRNSRYSSHVYDLDYIIAIDAGRGRLERKASRFIGGRVAQSFDITHTKSQDAARSRIHAVGASAEIKGFLHIYLGMRDDRLPLPVADFVQRGRVQSYPTNFSQMPAADLDSIAMRGEQLTRALIAAYTPDLS